MKTNFSFLFLAMFLFTIIEVVAQDDAGFIRYAASGGIMEVKLGKLAQERASSEEVKAFGRMMVEDHSKANQQLKQLARNNHYEVPDEMLDEQQKEYNKLSTLTGEEFDEAYMDLMVKDHKKDIKEFEEAADIATDPEIRAWAAQTVKVLKQHYDKAKKIEDKIN